MSQCAGAVSHNGLTAHAEAVDYPCYIRLQWMLRNVEPKVRVQARAVARGAWAGAHKFGEIVIIATIILSMGVVMMMLIQRVSSQ